MKRNLKQTIALSSVCTSALLAGLFSSSPAFADEREPGQAAPAKAPAKPFHLPDTPFLPPYCGRIVSGNVSSTPQTDGGIVYTITFETAEQPHQIINWYKIAFQQYGWNCDRQEPTQYSLSAQHGKNIASNVALMSATKKGARAQVQLSYRYVGRDI